MFKSKLMPGVYIGALALLTSYGLPTYAGAQQGAGETGTSGRSQTMGQERAGTRSEGSMQSGQMQRGQGSGANRQQEAISGTQSSEMASKVKRSIQQDNSLSQFSRNNVNVTPENGRLTLRGTVQSAQERSQIQERAESVAGKGKVTNELEVRAHG